jgi:hypothetical protein
MRGQRGATVSTTSQARGAAPSPPAPQAVPGVRPGQRRGPRRATVLGIALVAGAVLLGARTVSAADRREPVWSLRTPLAAGSVVTPDALVPAMAAADQGLAAYVGAGAPLVPGTRVRHDVAAGELLPVAALVAPGGADDRRLVTVAVEPLHAPPELARGERVDVYLTPRDSGAGPAAAASTLVLRDALVADVPPPSDSAAADSMAVVLDLPAAQAARAVAAVRGGAVDLVRVPAGAAAAPSR